MLALNCADSFPAIMLWFIFLIVLVQCTINSNAQEYIDAFSLVTKYLQYNLQEMSDKQLQVIAYAEQGDLHSLNLIGKALYSDKRTVFGPPNVSMASLFFYSAAVKRHVQASFNLGRCYARV